MDQIWEVCRNPVSLLLGYKEHHCTVAEAPTQHGMVLPSPPNICRVFNNLHILWMGTWNSRQAITTTSICLDLRSQLKSWFSAGLQRTPLCSGRGSNPTWNGSHIPSHHINGISLWQLLYDVDGHMYLCLYAITTTCDCSGMGSQPKFHFTAGLQTTPLRLLAIME